MKQLLLFIINKHLIIVRYIMVLIAIVGIAYIFPLNNFNYHFDIGEKWKYAKLKAPFDFTIQKTTDSLNAEKKRLLDNFYPYYYVEDSIKEEVKKEFKNLYANSFFSFKTDSTLGKITSKDSLKILKICIETLDTLYKQGIYDFENEKNENVINANKNLIMLRTHNKAQKTTKKLFLDISKIENKISVFLKTKHVKTIKNIQFFSEIITKVTKPNIFYDRDFTEKSLENKRFTIINNNGIIKKDDIIIAEGNIISPEKYQALMSLKAYYEYNNDFTLFKNRYLSENIFLKKALHPVFIGRLLIFLLLIGTFIIFLNEYEPESFKSVRQLGFLLLCLVTFMYLLKVILDINVRQNDDNSILYIMPFCILPIIIKTFFGSRMAHNLHIVVMLITGFVVPLGFEYLFLHFLAGLVAILSNRRAYYWSHFFKVIAYIFIAYAVGYTGILLITANLNINDINFDMYKYLAINSILTIFAYPLIPILEKTFGFTSNITLVELADLNKPLLKELSSRAAGTWAHSLQVSNLAEIAASALKANTQLAKVGALYHDIGKTKKPLYFIENQKTDINPHDDLLPHESAAIIKEHVTYGIELARQHSLPNDIIDFIRTHHGTTKLQFFYNKAVQIAQNTPDSPPIDESLFRHEGVLPYSKETGIVMIADSVEAASRSLQQPTELTINNLVDSIIDNKIAENQFINSNLSFKDITIVRKVLKKQLQSIYHVRVSYAK